MFLSGHSLKLLFRSTLATALLVFMAGAAQAEQPKRPYSIRYTTGVYSNAGWEKSIIEKDPNLARWNWLSVNSYGQGYIKVAPGQFATGKGQKPQGGHYIKPIHVSPLKYAQRRPEPVYTSARRNSRNNVCASLRKPQSGVAAAQPATMSYGNCYGRMQSPNPYPSQVGSTANQQCYGKLMSKQM